LLTAETEIIPKFTSLLHRNKPVVLHGDGSPTRRYLFAGDAADAFDTILHKGTLGHIYNVGSYDEISNYQLCGMLLKEIGIPNDGQADFDKWVKYTHDRPFNDHRYAVDGTKLRQLGWDQKTSFADGLRTTVQWYKTFGEQWWGDISKVLSPFPIVNNEAEVVSDKEEISDHPQVTKKRKVDDINGKINGTNGNGVHAVSA
jgi:dTDP-D-glucose 4,6-dehydratase